MRRKLANCGLAAPVVGCVLSPAPVTSGRPLGVSTRARDQRMTMSDTVTGTAAEESHHSLDAEQVGYKQSLGRRHVQMIAIGGAIGTGLFLGSASRLHSTGPALLLSYAFVGGIAYFLMRALGEL